MRNALMLALILAGALGFGCAMSDENGDTPTSHILREDRSSLRFDPVCGVPVNTSSALMDHWDGNTYFFHSEDCRRRFEEHPVAFVPGAKEPGPVQEVR